MTSPPLSGGGPDFEPTSPVFALQQSPAEFMNDDDEEDDDDEIDDEDEEMHHDDDHATAGEAAYNELSDLKALVKANLKELGAEATWVLSSAKSGNGAEQLRDGNKQTFWQSDGTHPHTITVQFHRKVALAQVQLYLDFKLDESYTPKKVRVLAGPTRFDLRQVTEKDFNEPQGWVAISLIDPDSMRPLRTFCLQISFVSMHQNGRDTHVRMVRLYGPTGSRRDDAFTKRDPVASAGVLATLR